MPYVISHFFPGGTAQEYEAVMVALNGRLGTIPEGQMLHVAGPVPGGFHVIVVQESKESWDKFMTEPSRRSWGRASTEASRRRRPKSSTRRRIPIGEAPAAAVSPSGRSAGSGSRRGRR
jgi:hypothetical protein